MIKASDARVKTNLYNDVDAWVKARATDILLDEINPIIRERSWKYGDDSTTYTIPMSTLKSSEERNNRMYKLANCLVEELARFGYTVEKESWYAIGNSRQIDSIRLTIKW